MPERFSFSKRKIDAIGAPDKGRLWVYDDRRPSLCVCITPTGHRSFYWYRKVNGRPSKVKIGNLDDVTIEQARKRAAEHDGEAAKGHDPADKRRVIRKAMTLDAVRQHYLDSKNLKQSTLTSEQSLWTTTLSSLHNRRLHEIASADVLKLHTSITKNRGERTANRAVTYLGRMFKHAIKFLDYTGPNPAGNVEKNKEAPRERFLDADELPRFLDAIEQEEQPFRDLFQMMLFTGQRSGNVRSMRWDDIDLTRRVWTIESEDAKNSTTQDFPLLPEAVEILNRRRGEVEGDYVFPPIRMKKRPYLSPPARIIERICKRAGIKGFTVHDIRRTHGSWLAMNGASVPIIAQALGHKDLRSAQIYARLAKGSARQHQQEAVAAMLNAGKAPKK